MVLLLSNCLTLVATSTLGGILQAVRQTDHSSPRAEGNTQFTVLLTLVASSLRAKRREKRSEK